MQHEKTSIYQFIKQLFKSQHQKLVPKKQVYELENRINYHFSNKNLIIQALKHRSYLALSGESRLSSNERLELLGDSVIGLIITEHLYKKFPYKEEGDLTMMKSLIVSRKILAKIANRIELGRYILLNEAEEKAGGRHRLSILADAFEAIIGAIYLDGGLPKVRDFVKKYMVIHLDDILNEEQNQNFKSMLLEYSQGNSYGLPLYIVKNEDGPDHNKLFTIEVKVNDQVLGLGTGNSKKKAEQMAAKNALKKLSLI